MRLQFLGPSGSLGRFPEPWELELIGRAHPEPRTLTEFVDAAWEASKRLWILDLHFEPYGFRGTELVLSAAQIDDVRILTGKSDDKERLERRLRVAVKQAWSAGGPKGKAPSSSARFEWRDRLRRSKPPKYPYAHDRFVVLDEGVWHFGHAACGSGNHLSAASGPWSAADTGAVPFFEDLWERLADE